MLRGRKRSAKGLRAALGRSFPRTCDNAVLRCLRQAASRDAAAMPAFAALVGLHADDALAGFHLRRLLNGGKGVRMQLE